MKVGGAQLGYRVMMVGQEGEGAQWDIGVFVVEQEGGGTVWV